MQDPIDWNDLRIFLQAAESGSFLAAGRRLGIDRTTVGRRIEALEKALGHALFHRDSAGCRPTEQALPVLEATRRMAAEVAKLAPAPVAVHRERIRIAVSSAFGDEFLEDIAEFHHGRPACSIEIHSVGDPIGLLLQQKADIGICVAREKPERLDGVCLGQLAIALYGSRQHPAPQAWVGWNDRLPPSFSGWFAEHLPGSAPLGTTVGSWSALKAAVASGMGVAPLWCAFADRDPALRRLQDWPEADRLGLWLLFPDTGATPRELFDFLRPRILRRLLPPEPA